MALGKQESEAEAYPPQDTPEALLEQVNEILGEAAFGAIDRQRLQEAMDRLKILCCLTSRAGRSRLREEMRYQVPEE